ncbi:hypothetical protein [Sphingomonas sp. NFR15]|uniref:hypothetical protein n=1 Tax=Sphingomonas sp. NFR15 TaxID=1566282 RepID=UPI00088C05B8|nr:hypothetical protein [Sphingomonas sp. NFR15]SDA36276.1 hypothetical protein SAMN03159340_03598 [Sphingomonas sp. NFR15]
MVRLRSLCAGLALCLIASRAPARDDPPTAFSQKVTAAVADWEAEDWRRGLLKLHPSKFTWQSDYYLEVAPEEPALGRTMQNALESAWANAATDGDDVPVSMAGAKPMGQDVIAKTLRWDYAFDKNLSVWGVAKTARGGYLPFHINCDTAHPDQYGGDRCLRSATTLLVLIQRGQIVMPEPPEPLTVPGWESQYLADGTSVLTLRQVMGTRQATVYATAPSALSATGLRDSITRFADALIDEDDKAPGPLKWVGTATNPWIRRSFPGSVDKTAVQMAGSVNLPDGRTVLVGVRCPNEQWLKDCAYAVDRTLQAVRSGQVEHRRQAAIAATQIPPPAGGLQDGQIAGLYTTGGNTIGAGGFMTGYSIDSPLFLRDGTAKRAFDRPPALIDPAASRRAEPRAWGRWTRSGNQIVVTWSDGDTDTIKVTPTNAMTAGRRGMKLSGKYRHVSGSGNIAFGGGNSVLSESSYSFFPDGTFSSDRSTSFMAGGGPGAEGASAMGGSRGAGTRGHYEVDGYTLKLTYPDGRVTRMSFAVYAHERDQLNREGLMLNGTYYFKDSD